MHNLLIALLLVVCIRTFAFRGTCAVPFIIDILLFIFLTTMLMSC
jgi:hypothetical protein